MKLSSLKTSGHPLTLFTAFLHFDVSFMIWVIVGALAPFVTSDATLTGVNLKVTPLPTVSSAGPITMVIKPADHAKGQPDHVYNLLLKPGAPAAATRASVKPIEKFVLDDADPATIAHLNSTSHLIRVEVAGSAKGNPNENVLPLSTLGKLAKDGKSSQPVANGYPASAKLTLVGIPLLAAAFWRILLGVVADRFGAKRVGTYSMAATLIPLMIGWQFGTTYASLMAVGFFLGLAGASFAVSLPLASRWYPPELQGVAMGIAGAGNSGTVMATIFAPLLAKTYGWHNVLGLLMIPVAITLVAFATLAKEPPAKGRATEPTDFMSVLKMPDLYAFCLLYFVTFGGFVGLSSFFNTFFVDQYDVPKAAVGLWTWPFIVAGSLLRPVGGALADRFGGIRMLTALYAVAALSAIGVAVMIGNFAVTAAMLLILMAALGMGNGSVFQLVPQRFGRQIGIVTGLVGAAGGVGGYYLNFALGHLHDASGTYATGFWALFGIAGVALIALRAVAPGWTRSWLGAGGRALGEQPRTAPAHAVVMVEAPVLEPV